MGESNAEYTITCDKNCLKIITDILTTISKIRFFSFDDDTDNYSLVVDYASAGDDDAVEWACLFHKVLSDKCIQNYSYVIQGYIFYGYYDAMRRNIVRKLEKEEVPELTKVARIAVNSMDNLCKMPNHYEKKPLTEAELQKYSYDIAAIILADYANTKPGQKYIEDAKKESGNPRYTVDFFKKLVKQVSESDAFKKALPKDLSKDGITKLITEGQEVHDLRGRFVTYMMREKNAAKEAARNALNGMNQPAKVGNQPIKNNNKPGGQSGNEEIKKPELKQRPM